MEVDYFIGAHVAGPPPRRRVVVPTDGSAGARRGAAGNPTHATSSVKRGSRRMGSTPGSKPIVARRVSFISQLRRSQSNARSISPSASRITPRSNAGTNVDRASRSASATRLRASRTSPVAASAPTTDDSTGKLSGAARSASRRSCSASCARARHDAPVWHGRTRGLAFPTQTGGGVRPSGAFATKRGHAAIARPASSAQRLT